MTTLTKLKQDKLSEIQSMADEIIQTRLRVSEAVQLANEMKLETDQGLSKPYPDMSLYYGKQRAILRGLTASDVMYFDLPTVEEWNLDTNLTFPSRLKFGFLFVDNDGNDSKIDDPNLYYLTRKKDDQKLSTIENDSDAFSYPTIIEGRRQETVVVNEKETKYEIKLNFPAAIPGSVKVYLNMLEIGKDNGNGKINGSAFRSASIDYLEKVILNFVNPLEKLSKIIIQYDMYTGVDRFNENYEQVSFSVTRKEDFGQTLDIVNLGEGVISEPPNLLGTMYLRRKADHRQAGVVQIICEGLMPSSNWDTSTGDPADYLRITHDQFKTLLGYLNPNIDNDLTKSANPDIISVGREDNGSYPDIEASPFFPQTDGEYTDSPPFTGNFVHSEEEVPKWSVHPDIKWQYGTAPASLGETTQNNPDHFITALNAIKNFSDAGNNPIPPDVGNASTDGYSYGMVGNYVHRYLWTAGVKNGGSQFSCYYNSAQTLKDGHLTHLQTQCGLIASLGGKANTIDTDRQAEDSQFITDTATFKTALDSFLSYHDAFSPLIRATYVTSQMTTLQAAVDPGAFLSQASTRLSDLDTVLGTATTSGYAKIIYDSCNLATHMDIGYLRDVLDELNSIQDLSGMVTKKQNDYSLLP